MNITRLLIDTVTLSHQTAVSESGDPTLGTQTTIKARVEHGSKLLTGAGGEALAYEHAFVTADAVLQTDRVWLPGDNTADATAARRPITVRKAATLDGATTLYEVYL